MIANIITVITFVLLLGTVGAMEVGTIGILHGTGQFVLLLIVLLAVHRGKIYLQRRVDKMRISNYNTNKGGIHRD